MPQEKIARIKSAIKDRPRPFMDSYEPGEALPKQPFGGNLVKPEDRVAKVSAPMPKEEQTSVFTPDKSENYSIRDKAPQDR